MMKIAVVGSRSFNNYARLSHVLNCLVRTGTVIVSGGALGADAMAERYAREAGLPLEVYQADWKTYGKAAGPIRNQQIVDACDIVVAFWDGKSRGTKNTIELARKAGKPCHVERVDFRFEHTMESK